MMLTFLLASRMHWLENIFGGLDNMYYVHRWAGLVTVVAIFGHWMLVPQLSGGSRSDWSITEIGSDTGEWATWLLLGLVAISFSGFIPYRYWQWTHRLMGLVLIISILHFLFAAKPFGLFSPTGIAMIMVAVIALWAWVYYSFGLSRNKKFLARISRSQTKGNVLELEANAVNAQPDWQAGQFAFIRVLNNPRIPAEAHPFTISSAPTSRSEKQTPRFSIATLGDYTRLLQQHIQPKDLVELEMPYGHFIFNRHAKRQVWVGAGIGITPFLAWLQAADTDLSAVELNFYYCVKTPADAIYHEEILAAVAKYPQINYQRICSTMRRLSAEQIYQDCRTDLANVEMYFCGAQIMRENIHATLFDYGLPNQQFHFEHFDFRGAK
mgnify:CR=1 FL=1